MYRRGSDPVRDALLDTPYEEQTPGMFANAVVTHGRSIGNEFFMDMLRARMAWDRDAMYNLFAAGWRAIAMNRVPGVGFRQYPAYAFEPDPSSDSESDSDYSSDEDDEDCMYARAA